MKCIRCDQVIPDEMLLRDNLDTRHCFKCWAAVLNKTGSPPPVIQEKKEEKRKQSDVAKTKG